MRIEEHHSGNLIYQDITTLDRDQVSQILEWRNHDSVRLMMNNSDLIKLEDHLNFVEKLKLNMNSFYWMVSRKKRPCGTVYLHLADNKEAEWGYYLNPQFLGTGVGLEVAFESIKFFFNNFNLSNLNGYVKVKNTENLRIQGAVGFDKVQSIKGEVMHLYLKKEDHLKNFIDDFKEFRKKTLEWKTKLKR